MTPSWSEFAPTPVTFESITFPPCIKKLGIVGQGEAVKTRIWPALQAISYPFAKIVVCSLESCSHLAGLRHQYYVIEPDMLLPLDDLDKQGLLSRDTLWIIATPSEYHVLYAVQLAGLCREALEKPIAATHRQARLLLPFTKGFEIHTLNHKVFNATVLTFADECRQDPSILRRACHIEVIFFEAPGISHGRQQENCIADVQWHLFTTVLAAFKAAAASVAVTVNRAWVATHEPDPSGRYALPAVWTASRLQGHLLWDAQKVTYDFRQAKGAPKNLKVIRLFGSAGVLLKELDLSETGWQAHARMLLALMQPVVDMRLTLADAIGVMELIDLSRGIASQESPYAFGTLPKFLA